MRFKKLFDFDRSGKDKKTLINEYNEAKKKDEQEQKEARKKPGYFKNETWIPFEDE